MSSHVPEEVARHAVALKSVLRLSYRATQDLLRARGLDVSHEAIRIWCAGLDGAPALPLLPPAAPWRAECRAVTWRREVRYLWLAMDEAGRVGELMLQARRNDSLALSRLRAGLAQQRRLAAGLEDGG